MGLKKKEWEQGTEGQAAEKKPTLKEEIISYAVLIIKVVLLAMVLRTFFIANAVVPTGSMESTVMPGDRILGLKCSYWFSGPERYDIIMFEQPLENDVLYLKRVIGLPGETVEIRDGEVYIDGAEEPLKDSFLKEEWVIANDNMTFEVPENCYFVLGDNRNSSFDSRYWKREALNLGMAKTEEEAERYTYVTKDQIFAKAYIKYWKKPGILR